MRGRRGSAGAISPVHAGGPIGASLYSRVPRVHCATRGETNAERRARVPSVSPSLATPRILIVPPSERAYSKSVAVTSVMPRTWARAVAGSTDFRPALCLLFYLHSTSFSTCTLALYLLFYLLSTYCLPTFYRDLALRHVEAEGELHSSFERASKPPTSSVGSASA